MNKVKIGIVGIGGMGSAHVNTLMSGKVENAELVAVCDIKQSRLEWAEKEYEGKLKTFACIEDLIDAKCCDALLIATPHYAHPTLGIQTLEAGLHVLVEKPIGVYTKAVEKLNEVASKSDKVFTIMYNQRTNPVYQKAKELIKSGELGELMRINWVITDWYRTEFYYKSGGWRATWEGEGGGVLLNQCPHQIDLIQWLCGMPERVRAFCKYGQYHDIEVEDDVTAYFEYANGATGTFITSTGEAPGTNRLEISGENGKLVIEKGSLKFIRNRVNLKEHRETAQHGFNKPESWEIDIPITGEETGHAGIMQYFVNAILNGDEQISPGVEGINGLSLSNAIHLSSWEDEWVTLPIDGNRFYKKLQEKIANSTVVKEDNDVVMDVKGTH